MKLVKNITIRPKETIYQQQVEELAKRTYKKQPLKLGEVMAIFIDQPTVSDLFICRKYNIRRCNDKEWLDYFNTFIGIKPIPKRKMSNKSLK